jgi:photosynthetic reaction center H subunit
MGTGAITSYFDLAQLVLYMFWAFFAGLIYYLLRENHREGYPMDTDRGVQAGWPAVPSPKTFKMSNGDEIHIPNGKVSPQTLNARPVQGHSGTAIEPVGNPLLAGVGPGSWADRADVPDHDLHGEPKIVPLRLKPDFGVAAGDKDPRGAPVLDADGEVAGTVSELWVDATDMLFRYYQITVKSNGREVLMPWNFARIQSDGVKVHALYAHQFGDVPGTKSPDSVTMLEEEKIMGYFGAGLLYADEERAEPLI